MNNTESNTKLMKNLKQNIQEQKKMIYAMMGTLASMEMQVDIMAMYQNNYLSCTTVSGKELANAKIIEIRKSIKANCYKYEQQVKEHFASVFGEDVEVLAEDLANYQQLQLQEARA